MRYMDIIFALKDACSQISNLIRNTEPHNLGNELQQTNESAELVKVLDLKSNDILKNTLLNVSCVNKISSEEEANYILANPDGKYMVAFDPLDGSSNIDCNATIGTIFGIYENLKIIGAGYCLYGGSTQFIYSLEEHDGLIKEQLFNNKWKVIRENYKMPVEGKYFSVNMANFEKWNQSVKEVITSMISDKYGLRYIGSLVGDGHRTLVKGGLFAYPSDKSNPNGKLRQYYEVVPFAYLFKKAGGYAVTDEGREILEEEMNEDLHYRRPLILMSKNERLYF